MKAVFSIVALLTGSTLTGIAISGGPAYAQDEHRSLIEEGRYLAAASDCTACHTVHGHADYTGGVPFALPIGTIYSTNITPDPDHGIGKYSETDFARALRQGIKKDGSTLYPAMPFPSYARLTDHDIHALYVYFHNGVKAEAVSPPKNKTPWPLSMRFPLAIWRLMFAPTPAAALKKTQHEFSDPTLARGAYLIEGPGHCGACHSPRGLAMQEKALTAADSLAFVSGGAPVDGWTPLTIRQDNREGLGRWNEDEIVAFLKTGRNVHGESFGGMSDAIHHGTQHLSDADLHAMARYLLTLKAAKNDAIGWANDPKTATALQKADFSTLGARVYVDNCAACHRTDGKGYPAVFPPLAGNPVVMGKDPTSLVHIIQSGATLPAMQTTPSAITMPDFRDRLSDQQIAAVVTFIRQAWGNNASAVTRSKVTSLKKSMPPRNMADNNIPAN